MWKHCKGIFADTHREELRYRKTTSKAWISDYTWKDIKTRGGTKKYSNRNTCVVKKGEPRIIYKGKTKVVKQEVKRDRNKRR